MGALQANDAHHPPGSATTKQAPAKAKAKKPKSKTGTQSGPVAPAEKGVVRGVPS